MTIAGHCSCMCTLNPIIEWDGCVPGCCKCALNYHHAHTLHTCTMSAAQWVTAVSVPFRPNAAAEQLRYGLRSVVVSTTNKNASLYSRLLHRWATVRVVHEGYGRLHRSKPISPFSSTSTHCSSLFDHITITTTHTTAKKVVQHLMQHSARQVADNFAPCTIMQCTTMRAIGIVVVAFHPTCRERHKSSSFRAKGRTMYVCVCVQILFLHDNRG